MTQPTFTTHRLTLRPWRIEDAPSLEKLLADSGFRKFSNLEPLDLEGARRELETRLIPSRDGFGFWAIEDGSGIVGVIQLKDQVLDNGESMPEMGYRLHQGSWGKGYATEAGCAIRDYACEELGIDPLVLFIDPDNTPSQAVAQRLGFQAGSSAQFKGTEIIIWSR